MPLRPAKKGLAMNQIIMAVLELMLVIILVCSILTATEAIPRLALITIGSFNNEQTFLNYEY